MGRWGRPVQNQSEKRKNLRLKQTQEIKTEISEINEGIKTGKKHRSLVLNLHTRFTNWTQYFYNLKSGKDFL